MKLTATRLCNGQDAKAAKPGDKPYFLRFGNGLYLLINPTGTKSWQVRYHVAAGNQATIIGRWPGLGVSEAKAKREEIRRTIRDGGDPVQDRHEQRSARLEADAATLRTIGEAWVGLAQVARRWSPGYTQNVKMRMAKHVYPVIGERPIGRVGTREIETLIVGLAGRARTQAVHVRQHLQLLFDFAMRRDLVTVNPVRKIAEDLPKRVRGDESEVGRAHVETIEEARAVLAAVERGNAPPFALLAHRLIALTAVRKMEGLEAQWPEVSEDADGMTWKIPAARMKGRRGQRKDHVIPLSTQAADVFRAARALQAATGVSSRFVFPGQRRGQRLNHSTICDVMARQLATAGLAGRHTVHGWRATFSTILNEADPTAYRVIDVMLAHKAFGAVEARYNKATFVAERRRIASAWAEQLLDGAPSAMALVGMVEADSTSNVVQLREAA